jgi:hypothetical protein
MESKPPKLGGPSDAGFPAKYPAKQKTLAGGVHAALRAISLLPVGRDILRQQGTRKGPRSLTHA